MNAIKELRNTTKMSQNNFAAYLGIPVANIQHWEQGVTTPPNYLIALISRVMKNDGYISNDLSPVEIDAIRQTKATLEIEELQLSDDGISEIGKLVKGEISREEFQKKLKEKYQVS
jgi:transcriptional regulator with XRE-family HTH domain